MNIRFVLLSTLLCFFLAHCTTHKQAGTIPLIIDLKVDKPLNENANENHHSYLTTITITNKADSIVSFWEMECSWQNNWILNPNNIKLQHSKCDYNFPILRRIKPKQTIKYSAVLDVLKEKNQQEKNNIRVGFIYIKESDYSFYSNSDLLSIIDKKKANAKDIIWSKNKTDLSFVFLH